MQYEIEQSKAVLKLTIIDCCQTHKLIVEMQIRENNTARY